jgi:hypothetical protein
MTNQTLSTVSQTVGNQTNIQYQIVKVDGAVQLQFLDPSDSAWEEAPNVVDAFVGATATVNVRLSNQLGTTAGVELALGQAPGTQFDANPSAGYPVTSSQGVTLTTYASSQSITLIGPCTITAFTGSFWSLVIDGQTYTTPPTPPITASAVVMISGSAVAGLTLAASNQQVIVDGQWWRTISTTGDGTATVWLGAAGSFNCYVDLALYLKSGSNLVLPITIVGTDGSVLYDDPTFTVTHVSTVGVRD